jgi:hypothetical protein
MMRAAYRRRKLGGMPVANRSWHGSVTLLIRFRRVLLVVSRGRPTVCKLLDFMVALTGIEPEGCQFSPVQFGLSHCKHVQLVRRDMPERRHRVLGRASAVPARCQRGHPRMGQESRPDAPFSIGPALPAHCRWSANCRSLAQLPPLPLRCL